MAENHSIYTQSAVIPWRESNGKIEMLVISSRKRKRWLIPKGIVEAHLTPAQSAAKEALEEAGVEGELDDTLLGVFDYPKWGGVCSCEVYSLRVVKIRETWQEDYRLRKWVRPKEAAKLISQTGLRKIILRFAEVCQQI
ncbi:NUDIX hydrolase [Candidatus Sumerlaeota bacterium]|nr:NUDIX hydrolase [Candidatus Sumerlaeota bacterium]